MYPRIKKASKRTLIYRKKEFIYTNFQPPRQRASSYGVQLKLKRAKGNWVSPSSPKWMSVVRCNLLSDAEKRQCQWWYRCRNQSGDDDKQTTDRYAKCKNKINGHCTSFRWSTAGILRLSTRKYARIAFTNICIYGAPYASSSYWAGDFEIFSEKVLIISRENFGVY